MRPSTPAMPAVILDTGHHGGLAIARSLGRLGAPVYAIPERRRAPACFSRYCRRAFYGEFEESRPGEYVDFLLSVARAIGCRPLLIPTTDTAALFVADHQRELADTYLFPCVPAGLVHALSSKHAMHGLARRLGVPTPDSFFPQSRADVLNFLHGAVFPVMVKAIDNARLLKRAPKTKYVVHSRTELLELYERIEDPDEPNLILQEYIPGGDDTIWMFNGYFDERSECLFGLTGKKIRQTPPYTGATSLGVCLPNPQVERTTLEFMKAVGYRGILDIGYRYDARDGQYKLLDVNPRVGSTFRLFVGRNGIDVVRACYLDLSGRRDEIVAAPARAGRKWVIEDFDTLSSIRYARDGRLSFFEWIRSFSGVEETAFLSLTDPLPVVGALLADLSAASHKLVRRRKPQSRPKPVSLLSK